MNLAPLSKEAQELKKGLYKHYKGMIMRVLGVGRHSETLEEIVIYEHVDDKELWTRPLKMFLETVEVDGRTMPRFEYIGSSP